MDKVIYGILVTIDLSAGVLILANIDRIQYTNPVVGPIVVGMSGMAMIGTAVYVLFQSRKEVR